MRRQASPRGKGREPPVAAHKKESIGSDSENAPRFMSLKTFSMWACRRPLAGPDHTKPGPWYSEIQKKPKKILPVAAQKKIKPILEATCAFSPTATEAWPATREFDEHHCFDHSTPTAVFGPLAAARAVFRGYLAHQPNHLPDLRAACFFLRFLAVGPDQ